MGSMVPFFKQPQVSKTRIAILDPCNFTRNSLANVLQSVTQLPAENIVGIPALEIGNLFRDSFNESIKSFDLVIIDQTLGEKYDSQFKLCDKSKIVFVLKVATAEN